MMKQNPNPEPRIPSRTCFTDQIKSDSGRECHEWANSYMKWTMNSWIHSSIHSFNFVHISSSFSSFPSPEFLCLFFLTAKGNEHEKWKPNLTKKLQHRRNIYFQEKYKTGDKLPSCCFFFLFFWKKRKRKTNKATIIIKIILWWRGVDAWLTDWHSICPLFSLFTIEENSPRPTAKFISTAFQLSTCPIEW